MPALAESFKPVELNEKDLKKTGIQYEAVIEVNRIVDCAKENLRQGFFLESLTAVDFAECFELVYHFNKWGPSQRSCVKVVLPKDAKAPSISSVYKAANWFER